MNIKTKANDLAFSQEIKQFYTRLDLPDLDMTYGLTKREYFAAMSLLQLFADIRTATPKELAKLAVQTADALIEELNKD